MLFFNGKLVQSDQAHILCNDRGLLLSDGLFETMRAYRGKIFRLNRHWDRLKNGASFLGIPLKMDFLEFERIAVDLLAKNSLGDLDAVLRYTITRGPGPRGLLPPQAVVPTSIMSASPFPSELVSSVSAQVVQIRRNEFSPLSNIKSLAYLDNVLARLEANQNGAEEAILLNTKGSIAEASAANVFIVTRENKALTPRLENGALPGITRGVVIEICKEQKIPITEEVIELDDLFDAKEVFLTNSVVEVQPVVKINGNLIGTGTAGQVTRHILDEYQKQTITTI